MRSDAAIGDIPVGVESAITCMHDAGRILTCHGGTFKTAMITRVARRPIDSIECNQKSIPGIGTAIVSIRRYPYSWNELKGGETSIASMQPDAATGKRQIS
jgi:hypothetical protein